MIEERRKQLLILYFKCSCIVEQCTRMIFVRENDRILNNANSLDFG